ncbi:MAG: ribonuclease R [Woeseiaceae bacterium]|nr:ribonuclease R [Woeseiaceae bacterium]
MARQDSKKKRGGKRRGAGKYHHPVPDRNALLEHLRDTGQPRKADAIMQAFDLRGQRMRGQLVDRLQAMVRAGQIIENRRGEYCLLEKLHLVTGTVQGHADGFGFMRRDDGGDDVYLSARQMRALFDGDRAVIKVVGSDRRGRPEGQVVEVLERAFTEVAGQFVRERGIGLVIPDNPKIAHRILVAKGESGNAKPGQMVVAEVLDYPSDLEQPTGRIVQVLGAPDKKGIATDIAIHANAIPNVWPAEVKKQAGKFGSSVPTSAKKGREDLRSVPLVTIDGADARDFDDAVYCEPSGQGWKLLVAIADVAHYVERETPLDREAIKRGTSVYFPDRVVPMLPEALSNGLCSLNPKVDRLCMVCEMRINEDGKATRSRFYEAVMRSHARLTYSEISGFLTGEAPRAVPRALRKPVHHLLDLYRALAKNRSRRGAIELDLPQTQIELGRDGTVKRIAAVPRNDAHRMIEEFMIAANVQAAKFLRRHRIPGLYRVHAKPDAERFEELRHYLLSLDLKVPHPDHVEPRQFNQLLSQVKDRPDSQAISMAMLRSLTHAEYTPANIGHFGLALDAYAHFTSPIRRYPDLLVHRAIRHIVRGGKAGNYEYDATRMEQLGHVCSAHERRAEDATREVEAWLKCQFMQDKVGEVFDGVITGVTNFGVFVQLSDLQIDGLVHVTSLKNDYYQFDPARLELVGERGGLRFRLGDEMTVQVQRVDLDTRRIDFRPVDDRVEAAADKPAPRSRRRGNRRR